MKYHVVIVDENNASSPPIQRDGVMDGATKAICCGAKLLYGFCKSLKESVCVWPYMWQMVFFCAEGDVTMSKKRVVILSAFAMLNISFW